MAVPIRCFAGALVSPASAFVGLRLVYYCTEELQIIAFEISFFNRFKTNPTCTQTHTLANKKNRALACQPTFQIEIKFSINWKSMHNLLISVLGWWAAWANPNSEINLGNWFKQKLSYSNFFSFASSSSSSAASALASFHFHDKTDGRSDTSKKKRDLKGRKST